MDCSEILQNQGTASPGISRMSSLVHSLSWRRHVQVALKSISDFSIQRDACRLYGDGPFFDRALLEPFQVLRRSPIGCNQGRVESLHSLLHGGRIHCSIGRFTEASDDWVRSALGHEEGKPELDVEPRQSL